MNEQQRNLIQSFRTSRATKLALILLAILSAILEPVGQHLQLAAEVQTPVKSSRGKTAPLVLRVGQYAADHYSDTTRARRPYSALNEPRRFESVGELIDPIIEAMSASRCFPTSLQLYSSMSHPAASPARWLI
jgi:hypothetical protein